MFLKKVKVYDYKSLKNLELIFPESNIKKLDYQNKCSLTVLIGENGTSKSTIFQFLKDTFEKFDSYPIIKKNNSNSKKLKSKFEISYSMNSMDFEFTNNMIEKNPEIILPKKVVLSTYSRIDKLEKYFQNKGLPHDDKIANLVSSIAVKISNNSIDMISPILKAIDFNVKDLFLEMNNHRTRIKKTDRNTPYDNTILKKIEHFRWTKEEKSMQLFQKINGESKDLIEKINEYYEEIKKISFYTNKSDFYSSRFQEASMLFVEGIKKDYGDTKSRNVVFELDPQIAHFYVETLFVLSKFRIMLLNAKNNTAQHKNVKSNKLISLEDLNSYNSINKTLKEDLELLNNFQINVFTDLWFDKNEKNNELTEIVPMSMLSSGELSLFLRLYELLEKVEDDTLVLIDEPETHLHPKWAKTYIKTLLEIIGQKRCHIIIATHSPLLVSSIPTQSLIRLKKENGKIIQIKTYDKTLGLNFDDMLYNVFLIKEKNDIELEYVNMVKRHLSEGELDKAIEIYSKLASSIDKYELFLEIEEQKNIGDK